MSSPQRWPDQPIVQVARWLTCAVIARSRIRAPRRRLSPPTVTAVLGHASLNITAVCTGTVGAQTRELVSRLSA